MTDLAQKIVEFRGAHDMSQNEFAELAGVNRVTIVKIENGYLPSKLTAAKILYAIKTKG